MSNIKRAYISHYLFATALIVTAGPYVAFTNTSASLVVIGIHAILLWLFIPPAMVLADWTAGQVFIRTKLDKTIQKDFLTLFLQISLRWFAVTVAILLMLTSVHYLTEIPWDQLFVKPLILAITPIYAAYGFSSFYSAWLIQRESKLASETMVIEAKFQALNARIQPHFLFNCLNAVEELIIQDRDRAIELSRNLANLYRTLTQGMDKPKQCLKDELTLVNDYLKIQTVRFSNRFTFIQEIPIQLAKFLVPTGILLTIVENAFKHGVERVPGQCQIKISANISDDHIKITVTNPSSESSSRSGFGKGLTDVSKRLELLYKQRSHFEIIKSTGEVSAVLSIPKEASI